MTGDAVAEPGPLAITKPRPWWCRGPLLPSAPPAIGTACAVRAGEGLRQHLPRCRLPVHGLRPALRGAARKAVLAAGLADVAVRRVGCLGLCAAGPLVEVPEVGRLFERVQPAGTVSGGDLLLTLAGKRLGGRSIAGDPFFSSQVRVVLERCGSVDPESLEDYVASGGYEALSKAVTTKTPDEVIAEVVGSGLRGEGRSWLPDGPQMEDGGEGCGRCGREVRRLQC